MESITARQCMIGGAILDKFRTQNADFAQSFFGKASVSGADFREANLADAKFQKATVVNSLFVSANCFNNDFSHTVLNDSGTLPERTSCCRAYITIQEKTIFKGANTFFQHGPDPDLASAKAFIPLG